MAKAHAEEMAWYDKFKANEDVPDETSVKNGDANRSPVDGQTSRKVTANVWKCEVDWSRVRSSRKGADSCFGGTPSLALVRYVITTAATRTKTERRRQLMVLDAKRAFLHADALTETYVKPPHLQDRERCSLLKKCMYGTLPAAAGWQHLVQRVGADIGAQRKQLSMCVRTRIARFNHGLAWGRFHRRWMW